MRPGLAIASLLLAVLAAPASGSTIVKTSGEVFGQTAQSSGQAVVKTAKSTKLGGTPIIVDARGMTLYMFVNDAQLPGSSACTDDATYHCSKHWPPLLTTGAPAAGPGVQQSLLGTITRPGGQLQVTYKGRPLYTWVGGYGTPADRRPGDVRGQGFSYLWYVVSPTGAVVKKKPKP